jgi:hypothetical protein
MKIPTTAGTPFAGGIYAGRFFVGAQPYALIVAPADIGELTATTWGRLKKVSGATSFNDGAANTQAMVKQGSKLAQWAQALRIGDFDDWYIPSRLELLTAFGELHTTAAFAKDWYWSSTQSASYDAYAWCQHFSHGHQDRLPKLTKLRARAVRRLAIE